MSFLTVKNLTKDFYLSGGLFEKKKKLPAVRGVSFEVEKGQTFGIVGESGSGKSTLGKCILKLWEPTSGEIWLNGTNLSPLNHRQMQPFRKKIQMIFQDPYASLNPKLSIGEHLEEPLEIHRLCRTKKEKRKRVEELLATVGLSPDAYDRYPHEFSGGQRQRVGIARAIAVEPEIIVCDEPVSALDVSIQAQILNLLKDLQEQLRLTYIFISHDLRVVEYLCHDLAVMYLGQFQEIGSKSEIFGNPKHPYTKVLLSSAPRIEGTRPEKILLQGEPPKPTDPPSGCSFHPRCYQARTECATLDAKLEPSAGEKHEVACPFS